MKVSVKLGFLGFKQGLLLKERICSIGANSFLEELTPLGRAAKMKNAEGLPLQVYFFLKNLQTRKKFK